MAFFVVNHFQFVIVNFLLLLISCISFIHFYAFMIGS